MSKILFFLSSIRLTVACLLLLAVLVFAGTLFEARFGLYAAQQRFFHSWFFLSFGWLPLPGVMLTIATLMMNLFAAIAVRFPRSWNSIGLIIAHLGIVAMLGGAAFTFYFARSSFVSLAEGESATVSEGIDHSIFPLPVRISLINFDMKEHPGTNISKSFESRLSVSGAGEDREVVVSMNRPFRHGNFTFFQASHMNIDGRELSVLAVVENAGRSVPWLSGIAVIAGLLAHFLLKAVQSIRTLKKAAA